VPVNIEQVTSDVTVFDDDLPLSQSQIDRLVEIVIQRLERRQREKESSRGAMTLRTRAMPSLPIDEY
jgi:hypothetical protein